MADDSSRYVHEASCSPARAAAAQEPASSQSTGDHLPKHMAAADQQPDTNTTITPRTSLLSLPQDVLGLVFERLDPASRRAFAQSTPAVAYASSVAAQTRLVVDLSGASHTNMEERWQRVLFLSRHAQPSQLGIRGLSSSILPMLMNIPEGTPQRQLLQGLKKLHLKSASNLDEDPLPLETVLLQIKKLCPQLHTLHLDWFTAPQPRDFPVLSALPLRELHLVIRQNFSCEVVQFLLLMPYKVVGLDLSRALDASLFPFSSFPEPKHLQLSCRAGSRLAYIDDLYAAHCEDDDRICDVCDELCLCPNLETLSFVGTYKARLRFSACWVYLPALRHLRIEQASFHEVMFDRLPPALELLRFDHLTFTGAVAPPADQLSRNVRHCLASSPRLAVGVGLLSISHSSCFEAVTALEPLTTKCRLKVLRLECLIKIVFNDAELNQLAHALSHCVSRVSLHMGSLTPQGLAAAILGWSGLEVLVLHGKGAELWYFVYRVCLSISSCAAQGEMLQARLWSGSSDPNRSVRSVLAEWQYAAMTGQKWWIPGVDATAHLPLW